MSYVTGISGNVISAASAGYAPTNSAEVSAIASAYATGKQDALTFGYDDDKISAINGSAIAGGGGGGSTISTGEFLGYTVVSADNGVSVVGNSGVVSSSVSVPYTDSTWATNTISANSNKSQFRIYNFNRTAGNMTSLPTGNSVRIRVTAATPGQSVYTDDQIHLIVYTGTNSGSPIGNWQVQSANGYKSAMWDKTVTWNSTNQPNMLITAENFNTYAFSTTALYSAVGAGSSASESSYTADVLAAHPSYVSSVASSYAESAVSSKADSSSLSSYALSADVSGTVDLVSTQSANWGGSALALSAGPGVKLEKVDDTLVVSTDGAVINEETIAGTWNGNTVYQMLLSGTGQTPGTSNIALPADLTSTSIASKWIDPSNSYILYGTTGNILPSTWVLGEGRYGSLDIIGVNVTMRSTDNGSTNCSAFFNVKYIKAET